MNRLLYAAPSPYSSKARMALTLAGIAFEGVATETRETPSDLAEANPLGKIPVLILSDGRSIYDSGVIARYADRMSGNGVYPLEPDARLAADVMDALGTGLCDVMLAMVYERRFRPENKVHEEWIERQRKKARRGFARIEDDTPPVDDGVHGGHIALRCAIGYAALRMPDLLDPFTKTAKWAKAFDEAAPELGALIPSQ